MISTLNFPLSLFLSVALIPLLMRYANLLGLVDRPDGVRKIHTKVIPKSGGLAIAIAVFIPIAYSIRQLSDLVPLLIGSFIIVVFGFLDDRYELNYKWKFFGQIVAIVVFLGGTQGVFEQATIFDITVSGWVLKTILFVFLLGVSNAINLSDGLDGLAAGVTFISLALIAYIANKVGVSSVVIVAMAIMGALMGFLRYNTHPAQVFMGDTGSQFIGFTSAALAVYLAQFPGAAISPILPVLILGLPIMDTLMVMSVRLYSGKSPFYPDKNHIHHQLIKFGFRHYEAVAILYFLQIALIITAYFFRFSHEIFLIFIYVGFASICLGFLYIANSIKWRIRKEDAASGFVERRNLFLRSLSWVYEYNATIILIIFCFMWTLLSVVTVEFHGVVKLLALVLLLFAFTVGIFFPARTLFATRMLSYSAAVLTLYVFSAANIDGVFDKVLNASLILLGAFLILCIKLTRKELFQLNNQDIIILFILLVGPLLPFDGQAAEKMGGLLFRISIVIYAIEFFISRSPQKNVVLRVFSSITLFSMCFI